jgi:hypothetical protein
MPVICRLIEVTPADAARILARPAELDDVVKAATRHTGVYRYWHAIDWLLAQHLPGRSGARLLEAGTAVTRAAGDVPGSRVLDSAQARALHEAVSSVTPEALAPHYDAAALDAAGVYPATWVEWEETFDPLGQVLEHYTYLQFIVADCANAGDGMVLRFVFDDDGSDD